MAFMDFLGSVVGKMASTMQDVQKYKSEYEYMSDNDLKREYNRLKNDSWKGTEGDHRLTAVKMILSERGLIS